MMKGARNDSGDSGNDYLFAALFSMIINAIIPSADVRVWVIHWGNEGVSKWAPVMSKWAPDDEWYRCSSYVRMRRRKEEGGKGGEKKGGEKKRIEEE